MSQAERVGHDLPVRAGKDYIVGGIEGTLSDSLKDGMTDIQIFTSMSDFSSIIGRNDGKKVRLWIYNIDQEKTRAVDLTPNSDWGGPGSIGCDVVMGALHVIPRR